MLHGKDRLDPVHSAPVVGSWSNHSQYCDTVAVGDNFLAHSERAGLLSPRPLCQPAQQMWDLMHPKNKIKIKRIMNKIRIFAYK